MYLRFVRLIVREGAEAKFAEFYRNRVLPALSATAGCRFAGLLTPWRAGDAHRSLTIWDSPEQALAYEQGGLYPLLLSEAEPLLSKRTEWRVRLGKDPLATIDPLNRVIPSEGYLVDAGDPEAGLATGGESIFVRILSVRVDLDRIREFVQLYTKLVIPAVQMQPGCRGVLLAEGAEHPDGILSISLWDREEDAVRYETSGQPERLTEQLKPMFSPIYDWCLTLTEGRDPRDSAPRVETYHLVPARRAGPTDSSA
jgi:heme-degrading monooxygenase HmoA